MLPCPAISPAHKLPTKCCLASFLTLTLPFILRPCVCLPVCFASLVFLANKWHLLAKTSGLSVPVTAFIPSTGFCLPQVPPKFLLRLAPITFQERTVVVTEAFVLYIKIESSICFYFPKSVSGVETPELRQRGEARTGLTRVWVPAPETSESPL